MRIPPLKLKIMLESNPLKSRILVRRLAVVRSSPSWESVAAFGTAQAARERALNDFRNGRVSTLVATDVAARGLDLPGAATLYGEERDDGVDTVTR